MLHDVCDALVDRVVGHLTVPVGDCDDAGVALLPVPVTDLLSGLVHHFRVGIELGAEPAHQILHDHPSSTGP